MMFGVNGRPIRPGTPPSPPPHLPQQIDPFQEPEIGFFNGLKTGLKAIVNSSVDTPAGAVSLGKWDPADVWDVDPVSDVGYDGARIFADIGTNTALAAVTGDMASSAGRVGQIGRILDRMDTAASLIGGVQGAFDATQNELNAGNGMQMAMGLMGVAQPKLAFSGMSGTEVANQIRRVEPDRIARISHRTNQTGRFVRE